MVDEAGAHVIRGAVAISAAIAATAGSRDAHWLRQLDVGQQGGGISLADDRPKKN